MKSILKFGIFLLIGLNITQCSSPRNIIHSGQVTDDGGFQAGFNSSYNIPTATLGGIYNSLENGIEKTINSDSVFATKDFNTQTEALAIYSIDPIGATFDMYIRYGIYKNFDIGYAWSNGVNVFDTRYQFLNEKNSIDGSIGIQYSSQSYELPSYIGDLQSFLQYEMHRTDLLFPLIFSTEFGENEEYGALSYGLVYGRSKIEYDFKFAEIYELISDETKVIDYVPRGETSFNTYGLYLNIKGGYKYIYVMLGMSVYYQDYGEYKLFADHTARFAGITFVPNFGVQAAF